MSVNEICEKYGIKNYTINLDGSIDVNGSVEISDCELTEFPLIFNKVSGTFYCQNSDLTTLKGSPRFVGGSFYCQKNKLTSLLGSPKSVGGGFHCSYNNLTNLKGCPEHIGGDFRCDRNNIFSLEGLDADSLSGNIYLHNNPIGSLFYVIDSEIVRAFNSYKVIKENEINLKRLRYAMESFDQPIYIESIKKYYTIK